LLDHIWGYYEEKYPEGRKRPELELILGGYDKRSQIPKIVRIKLPEKEVKDTIKDFGMVFGGQMKEIQRIVHGTDPSNKDKIYYRHLELLRKYRDKINTYLEQQKIKIKIPELSVEEVKELNMFSDG
jgi:hypothetical protein